jgi:hypothetical protein
VISEAGNGGVSGSVDFAGWGDEIAEAFDIAVAMRRP